MGPQGEVREDRPAACLRQTLLVLDCRHGQEKSSSQETEEKEGTEGGGKESCQDGEGFGPREEQGGCEGKGRGVEQGTGEEEDRTQENAAERGSERVAGKSRRRDGAAQAEVTRGTGWNRCRRPSGHFHC